MTTYVVDIDGTLCGPKPATGYIDCEPHLDVINAVNSAYDSGCHIILFTSRGMRSYKGNLQSIRLFVKPTIEEWLAKHGVKYHELIIGKPWGEDVYYIDDRALLPIDFVNRINQNDNSNYTCGRLSK